MHYRPCQAYKTSLEPFYFIFEQTFVTWESEDGAVQQLARGSSGAPFDNELR
jgi:hypothetical protein